MEALYDLVMVLPLLPSLPSLTLLSWWPEMFKELIDTIKLSAETLKNYGVDIQKFNINNNGLNPIETSKGINDALNYEEKNKYGCQNSFTDYEDEFQISIADRIREQKF